MNHWPLQRDCPTFYGKPDPDGDGHPNRAWEDANLVRVTPPWTMYPSWDLRSPLKTLRMHKSCANSLSIVLGVIWAHVGHNVEKIENFGLHITGGTYNFRPKRGGSSLSMHSYACAIDLSPILNPWGQPWRPEQGMMPLLAVVAFEQEGWTFGGHWSKPDAMHFQAARVR